MLPGQLQFSLSHAIGINNVPKLVDNLYYYYSEPPINFWTNILSQLGAFESYHVFTCKANVGLVS